MGTIWQPTYRDRKTGQQRKSKVWRIAYTDEHGARQNVGGFRDKKASAEKLRQLELRVDRIAAGLPVEGQGAEPSRGVEESIVAWLAELARLGRTEKYIKENGYTVRAAAKACRWRLLGDIKPGPLGEHLAALAGQGRATHTVNHVRDKVAFFCCYCVRQGWLSANPVEKVRRSKAKVCPKARRAFTSEELQRLAAVHPRFRDLVLVAALSGLRRKELRLLEKRDVVWEPSPRFHLRAEATKARRADEVPMLPECAEILKPLWMAAASPTTRLFAGICCSSAAFNRLLRKAGIAKRDETGRQVDFHALRRTFCTLLGRKLPIQIVSRLMRHTDIRTTVRLYLDLGIGDMADEIDGLPRFLGATAGAKAAS